MQPDRARSWISWSSSSASWARRSSSRSRLLQNSGLPSGLAVKYDARTDTLTVVFRDVPVAESDEDKPGVILDYDAGGNIVLIEVLDASKRVEEPRKVIVETAE